MMVDTPKATAAPSDLIEGLRRIIYETRAMNRMPDRIECDHDFYSFLRMECRPFDLQYDTKSGQMGSFMGIRIAVNPNIARNRAMLMKGRDIVGMVTVEIHTPPQQETE